jgi:hypothetical protein
MEARNSKLQHPEKFQAANTNMTAPQFGTWFLVLLWSLDVGSWSFLEMAAE